MAGLVFMLYMLSVLVRLINYYMVQKHYQMATLLQCDSLLLRSEKMLKKICMKFVLGERFLKIIYYLC